MPQEEGSVREGPSLEREGLCGPASSTRPDPPPDHRTLLQVTADEAQEKIRTPTQGSPTDRMEECTGLEVSSRGPRSPNLCASTAPTLTSTPSSPAHRVQRRRREVVPDSQGSGYA